MSLAYPAPTVFQYAIYDTHTLDHPDKWVVLALRYSRSTGLVPDTKPHAVTDTLEEARSSIPLGMYILSPWVDHDDDALFERWSSIDPETKSTTRLRELIEAIESDRIGITAEIEATTARIDQLEKARKNNELVAVRIKDMVNLRNE